MGPTDIITLEIQCLEEVVSGGMVGDGEGEKRKGGNKLKWIDGSIIIWSHDF